MNATHPIFQQLLKPFAPPPVEICRIVDGQRVYPRVIIWRAGKAIASGGLHVALGRVDPAVARVFVRARRDGSAIVTLNWADSSWSSFPMESAARALEVAAEFRARGLWPKAELI